MMHAYYDLQQAEANVDHLYELLFEAILAGRYELGKEYNGFKIVSVWEAKPVAWRPAAFLQYDFGLLPADPPLKSDWPEVQDLIAEYHKAYGAASAARSKFHALYTQAVLDWLKDPESNPGVRCNYHQEEVVQLRCYEVKQVK